MTFKTVQEFPTVSLDFSYPGSSLIADAGYSALKTKQKLTETPYLRPVLSKRHEDASEYLISAYCARQGDSFAVKTKRPSPPFPVRPAGLPVEAWLRSVRKSYRQYFHLYPESPSHSLFHGSLSSRQLAAATD